VLIIEDWFNAKHLQSKDNSEKIDENLVLLNEITTRDSLFKILSSDIILINENYFEEYQKYIPKTHIHLSKKRDVLYSFEYQQGYFYKNGKTIPNNEDIADEFMNKFNEKSWEEELSWRMVRVYEKRMLKENSSYEEKSYELLKPICEKRKDVERIYYMTFPSILESIQVGNGEQSEYKTTLTKGFPKNLLKQRHEILLYQHRMHPEIAKFSRESFYTNSETKEVALQDSNKIDRDWSYKRYSKRAVWINVENNNIKKDNKNESEAKKLIDELRHFIEFAKNNPKDNKESWIVGVITFYRPQEALLREKLREYCNKPRSISRFEKDGIEILLYTVDKFQGMEADVIFLSMVRNKKIGFLDNINRLNVALTRAKYQRVIFGYKEFFLSDKNRSTHLKELAKNEFEERL
ncbi:hypothetical protein JXR93_01585, partial [bacterium]|nr:hypothetical protein [bacterium]